MADDLIEAAQNNEVPLMKQLIERGADVNGDDLYGRTALIWAALSRFVECVKVLLEANADVNKADRIRRTPLHMASDSGHAECVKLLIDWKANVNDKTNNGHSPLHWIAFGGHFACVEMLIQAGADVDARDNPGNTPLVGAIINNKRDVAELLLDKGARMSNVREGVPIPDWMKEIVSKRENVKRGLLTFIGVLRKRFTVSGGGTEYTRGRLPRDVVGVISKWAWSTRFDKRWEGAVSEMVKKL